MRLFSVLLISGFIFGGFGTAQAFEKFIPLGTGYSTGVNSLPSLNSDAEALTVQSDIYETELYRKQLERRQQDSYINRFFSNSDSSGPDFSVDY